MQFKKDNKRFREKIQHFNDSQDQLIASKAKLDDDFERLKAEKEELNNQRARRVSVMLHKPK